MFLFQHRLVRLAYPCYVSLTGRSLFCNRFACLGRNRFLLTGLPIIFKPLFLSRISSDQFRNSFSLLSDIFLFCRPVFWGESELYSFAVFCQGFFQNSFISLQSHPFFVLAVFDSETQLYASGRLSQGLFVLI